MNLNTTMANGISQLVKTVGKFYLGSPSGIAFLAQIAPEIKKSARRRQQCEDAGTHVPPLVIASVTSRCNLHCAGCYSRANGSCSDSAAQDMDAAAWEKILTEASGLGVSIMLLAGGEPLMRRDVVETAAKFPNMVFPIFTNGTMMDAQYFDLFARHRNLIPVFSMEGDQKLTDARRGDGSHETVRDVMRKLQKKKMLFGASITVTKENTGAVANPSFVDELRKNGCGLLFFVEYVPVDPATQHLMLQDSDVQYMQNTVAALKKDFSDMILVSFPGDEDLMGGCLASGRGFFHINASGGAEPCPFSPHAEMNLQANSMCDVLRSEYFQGLRKIALDAGHDGGCTLFQNEDKVRALLQAQG